MKILLWLDDIRNPIAEPHWLTYSPIPKPYKTIKVIWVKSYNEFTEWITNNGLPDAICFDHDLGMDVLIENSKSMSKRKAKKLRVGTKTGKDCANWLVDYCIDNNKDLPLYNIQSANPVGKENIDGLLKGFNKFKNNHGKKEN